MRIACGSARHSSRRREYLPELERVTKERDAKLAGKQNESLARFMQDLAVTPQAPAPESWDDEQDEVEETDDVYGDDPRVVDIRRARNTEVEERDNEFRWPRPG